MAKRDLPLADSIPDDNGPDPETNGFVPKKPRKPRAKVKVVTEQPDDQADAHQEQGDQEALGISAADMKTETLRWLYKPWVPEGMLTILVGEPNVGKSTFLAWLTAAVGRTLIFPGSEEIPTVTTLPRLLEHGVDPHNVRFMHKRAWVFPRDRELLTRAIWSFGARLVTLDPLDSYKPSDVHEKDNDGVRKYLESLAAIGVETGAAFVGVRHPGKEKGNLLRGAMQWRAVPRSVILLKAEGGFPKRYIISQDKPQLGQGESSRYYTIIGEKGKIPRFTLGAEVDKGTDELTRSSDGETGRAKLTEACELIRHMFEVHGTPTVQDVVKEARLLGIGLNMLDEAKRLLGVRSRPQCKGGDWVLIRTVPEWPDFLKKRRNLPTHPNTH